MAHAPFELGDQLPTIPAGRVRLRWLTDADVPALLAIFGDSEVMRYWSHGPFKSIDDAREYLRQIRDCFAKRELLQWGVELLSRDADAPAEGAMLRPDRAKHALAQSAL